MITTRWERFMHWLFYNARDEYILNKIEAYYEREIDALMASSNGSN